MSDKDPIEVAIRQELAAQTSCIRLSNKFFAPGGLFGKLASTEEERRAVTQTALFREAMQRISELREIEFAQFSQAVEQFEAANPGEGRVFKVEQAGHV